MAVVTSFTRIPDRDGAPHPTQVECRWKTFDAGTQRMLQLDTFGSNKRQILNKVSQTLQLDRKRASDLMEIIRATLPELK